MENKPKIVFILATNSNTNNIKRIEAFINAGYEVEVYSFSRGEDMNHTNAIDISILSEFSNNVPYWKRVKIMRDGIKRVLNKTKGQKCIYYLIRNDVALVYSFMSRRPYIFEEADMTHVNFGNQALVKLAESRIKYIIRHSVCSTFRSEGFVKYHFGDDIPDNVFVIPNKLSSHIKEFPTVEKKPLDINHLKFGFVGVMRLRATYQFVDTLLKNYPQHEFHFYGICTTEEDQKLYDDLKQYPNCFFHGRFKSPDELASIYSNIDIVLSTYETQVASVRYLESNKIYEAIYFETPVIVTPNTYLAGKVKKQGIGFELDTFNEQEVLSFINNLTEASVKDKVMNIIAIDKDSCISKGYMAEFEKWIK